MGLRAPAGQQERCGGSTDSGQRAGRGGVEEGKKEEGEQRETMGEEERAKETKETEEEGRKNGRRGRRRERRERRLSLDGGRVLSPVPELARDIRNLQKLLV